MELRKLTKADLDRVRDREGFPIADDEDIIALSDAPYYTACPNPFVEEFIAENGSVYDESTDNYRREPFAADVSEGKTDPIYMAHTYHTKVPHKAIMNYILHYTKPGDIVFDGFCGTGMTALAAQMCNQPHQLSLVNKKSGIEYGPRKAIISDLSPVATFIAHNYTSSNNQIQYDAEVRSILDKCQDKYGWMYQTKHSNGALGTINYVVWSDVFICPTCGEELVFWDVAVGDSKEVKNPFICHKCGSSLKKSSCTRTQELVIDNASGEVISQAKQVPVLINYEFNGKKYEKKPDANDLEIIEKVKEELKK